MFQITEVEDLTQDKTFANVDNSVVYLTEN
jgi:hypothetical protein